MSARYRSRQLNWRNAAVVSLAGYVLLTAAPASAADSALDRFRDAGSPLAEPSLGPGWIGYSAEEPLRNATVREVQGARLDDGACAFDYQTKADANTPSQVLRERGFNESLCMTIVEVGQLSPAEEAAAVDSARAAAEPLPEGDPVTDSEAPSDTEGYTEDLEGGPIVEPDAGAGAGFDIYCLTGQEDCLPVDPRFVAKTRTSEGYNHSYLEDPIGINVTETKSWLNWTYNPSGCVSQRLSWYNENWYEPSGWFKVRSSMKGGYDCAHAWTSTYGYYKNAAFCPSLDILGLRRATRSIYDRNVVRGFANYVGSLIGKTRHIKRGGCASFLKFTQKTVQSKGGCPGGCGAVAETSSREPTVGEP
jgi:hypothetical protein